MISKRNLNGVVSALVLAAAAAAAPSAHAGTKLGGVLAGPTWGEGWNSCRYYFPKTNYIKNVGKLAGYTKWDCYKN